MKSEKKTLESASKLVLLIQKFRFLKLFRYVFVYLDKILMFLFVRKPEENENAKKQVLLIPNLGIGDAIHFLTTVDKYREAFPKNKYEITFMCRASVIDLFKNETDFDYFETLNLDEGLFNLKKRVQIFKKINQKNYDIIVDTPVYACSMNVYVCLASYIKERITIINRADAVIPEFILKRAYTKIFEVNKPNYPIIKLYNKLIDGILNDFDNEKINFHRTKQYPISINLPKNYFMVFPSSKLDRKKWEVEKYSKIIKKIYQKTGYKLIICGTQEDYETIKELKKHIKKIPHIIKIDEIPLMEYIQIIKGAKFIVTNDSGAYHIAVSENVPVTVITGKYAFDKYMLFNFKSNQKIIQPYIVTSKCNCKNCYDNCSRYNDINQIYPCLKDITVEQAWKVIEKMINEINEN